MWSSLSIIYFMNNGFVNSFIICIQYQTTPNGLLESYYRWLFFFIWESSSCIIYLSQSNYCRYQETFWFVVQLGYRTSNRTIGACLPQETCETHNMPSWSYWDSTVRLRTVVWCVIVVDIEPNHCISLQFTGMESLSLA